MTEEFPPAPPAIDAYRAAAGVKSESPPAAAVAEVPIPVTPSELLRTLLAADDKFMPKLIQSAVIDARGTRDDPCPGFRFWPVEPMLADANVLVDKCLDTIRRLDGLWKEEAGLQLQEALDKSDSVASGLENEYDTANTSLALKQLTYLQKTKVTGAGVAAQTLGQLSDLGLRDAGRMALSLAAPKAQSDGQAPQNEAAYPHRLTAYAAMTQIIQQGLQEQALSDGNDAADKLAAWKAERRTGAANVRALRQKFRKEKGPLDYVGQIQREMGLLQATHFRDVVERCRAIRFGLEKIFGQVTPSLPDLGEPEVITRYADWIRRQTSFLAKFAQMDQGYIVSVSLQAMGLPMKVGDPIRVVIPKTAFASHNLTRLRGVSAFVESDMPRGVFRVKVSVPEYGLYIGGGDGISTVYQGRVPPCVLGRVMSRESNRPPEVGGAVSMMNASPLGVSSADDAWVVQVEGIGLESSAKLTDVCLELSLVGQPIGAV